MKCSRTFIDQHLDGKNIESVIDSIIDDCPPIHEIKRQLSLDLPEKAKMIVNEADKTIKIFCEKNEDRWKLNEILTYYEVAYPEIEFVRIKRPEQFKK